MPLNSLRIWGRSCGSRSAEYCCDLIHQYLKNPKGKTHRDHSVPPPPPQKEPTGHRDKILPQRKDGEVDLVVLSGTKVKEPIQVCYDPTDPDTKKRETKALLKAMDEFKLKTGTVITWDHRDKDTIDGREITYIPLWKWLLGLSGSRAEKSVR